MFRKIVFILLAILLWYSCDYEVIDSNIPEKEAITFRKTLGIISDPYPLRIIEGHENDYVVVGGVGESVEDPTNGFIIKIDSVGNIISSLTYNNMMINNIVKSDQGYAILKIMKINSTVYSSLSLLSKNMGVVKENNFGQPKFMYLSDIIKTNTGFGISGYIQVNYNANRYFIKTDLAGNTILGPKTYSLSDNQLIHSIVEEGNGFTAVGYSYNGGITNPNIMMTFINQNGDEYKTPVYLGSNRYDFPYGLVKFGNGYAIFGKYDDLDHNSECFLLFCDKNGNELSNSPKGLGIYDIISLYNSAPIIQTKDGGLAVAGQSLSHNIVLLLFDNNGNQKDTSPIEFNFGGNQSVMNLSQTEDDGFAIIGTTDENGNNQLLILKTDKDGKIK